MKKPGYIEKPGFFNDKISGFTKNDPNVDLARSRQRRALGQHKGPESLAC